MGVSCGVIAVLVCAYVLLQVQKAKGQSWLVKRRINQMRNCWRAATGSRITQQPPRRGGSQHRAGSAQLWMVDVLLETMPPLMRALPIEGPLDNQATAKEGNVTVRIGRGQGR